MVKQLSKANPTKKRHKVNCQNVSVNAVATPARNPIKLAPIKAGILPYWSAIHPKISPPKIAPTKKILWAMVGRASYWQTHPSCQQKPTVEWFTLGDDKRSQEFRKNVHVPIKFPCRTSGIPNETRFLFLPPLPFSARKLKIRRKFSRIKNAVCSGCWQNCEEKFSFPAGNVFGEFAKQKKISRFSHVCRFRKFKNRIQTFFYKVAVVSNIYIHIYIYVDVIKFLKVIICVY